jgi:hypothetical protein
LFWSEQEGRLSSFDLVRQAIVWEKTYAELSKIALCDDAFVGVVQPDGRFEVLDAANGQVVLAARVAREHLLEQIYLLRTPESFLLAVHRGVANSRDGNSPARSVQITGVLYGFEATSGRQLFATDVDHQTLSLDQPMGLPILTFARITPDAGEIKCVDIRTGRTVYAKSLDNQQVALVDVVGNPDESAIEVRTTFSYAKLFFTDRPWPSPEEEKAAKSRLGEPDEEPDDEPAEEIEEEDAEEEDAEKPADDADPDKKTREDQNGEEREEKAKVEGQQFNAVDDD